MGRGRPLVIPWQDDLQTFVVLFRHERDPDMRARLQALMLLRQGRTLAEVSLVVGVHYRTLQRWVSWYRDGGLQELRLHKQGGGKGRPPRLNAEQLAELIQHARRQGFSSWKEAALWIEHRFGVCYTYWGMRSLFRRHRLRLRRGPS
ncbi:MAG: helix-turn-helix domain-containing protein [Bacteroidetes bacterium]|nr:helix-turn-helix domain-containing protein [Rhodothermia bacterium]MCX7907214.1 helix-turn-helix domain-containing protein [Bacteroidota bacterium]MDW8286050.1 helix-turn-helix domain-containing protein [Bacteroidota bacterium]